MGSPPFRSRVHQWVRQLRPTYFSRPFSRSGGKRVLMVSLSNPISQSQIHPFHVFAPLLNAPLQLREVDLPQAIQAPETIPCEADVVLLQTWIDQTDEGLRSIVSMLRTRNPKAKLVYLDAFAPTDLRYAKALSSVDLYVKKHVLRDRSRYGEATLGDTNLTDFYSRHYGLSGETTRHTIPEGFLSKLLVGPSFFLGPDLMPRFFGAWPGQDAAQRRYGLHAKLGGLGSSSWYERMRSDAQLAVDNLAGVRVTPKGAVPKRVYMAELGRSRSCFSPFGYGEVCWRDYEAAAMGAALIKPDMSHIETAPDIFRPHETYLPISWTFEDLAEAVRRLSTHPEEAQRLSRNAFETLATYCQGGGAVRHLQAVLAS